jgi:hypothetical protein
MTERVVLEDYPASKLPVELRGDISLSASVRVTVEERVDSSTDRQQLLALMDQARRNAKKVTLEEAVQRVRELRDEWD